MWSQQGYGPAFRVGWGQSMEDDDVVIYGGTLGEEIR